MAILLVLVTVLFVSTRLPDLNTLLAEATTQPWLVFGSVGAALLLGTLAEGSIYTYRLTHGRRSRLAVAARGIAANWLVAVLLGIPLLGLLISSALDSLPMYALSALILVYEAVGVVLLSSKIYGRWSADIAASAVASTRRVTLRVSIANLASMLAGIGGWRLYLILFYPGVG